MLAQVFKPIRHLGSRLAATQIGLKPAVEPEQHHVFTPCDADPCALESSLKSPSILESTLRSPSAGLTEKAPVVPYNGIEDLQVKASKAAQLALRFLPDHISDTANVVSSVESGFQSVETCGVEGIAANATVNWPTQQQTPWADMYQAREASFHLAQFSPQMTTGAAPHGLLVLQPMIMPVYSPFWGMQLSVATQQSGGATSCTAGSVEEVSVEISSHGLEENASSSGVRRHRRARRGGMAKRKSTADETQEISLTAPDLSSAPRIRCWADADPEADEDLEPILSVKVECQVEEQSSDVTVDSETTIEGIDQLQSLQSMRLESNSSMESPVSSEDSAGIATESVDPLLLDLEAVGETRREEALAWVGKSFWPLALTKRGCRIVQKAIDVGTSDYQQELIENLQGRVHEAVKSPHANYVLQKFIESMPPEKIQFVLTEIEGHGLNLARHRFGCRILQRLIEHSHPWQTEHVINEVLVDTAALCRHQYGNFVIQHILQHGSPAQRSVIADTVCADIIRLAKHRIASHVVSCAMVYCPPEDVKRLTHAVLHDAGQLADLSRREYGSFVVREVNRAARMLRT